ncbi:MAG: HD domain-containing protein [Chloroflexota bacterium]|nr:HD domain-containing protein [Chloroflexota bacterium]
MPDDQNLDRRIESAIVFLVFQMQRTGRNSKPVVLHSIRVALYLHDRGYGGDVVVAAALHDLLEDSDTTLAQIEREFGAEVARLVEANTSTSISRTTGSATERCSCAARAPAGTRC